MPTQASDVAEVLIKRIHPVLVEPAARNSNRDINLVLMFGQKDLNTHPLGGGAKIFHGLLRAG
jgi:hypothetical protein